MSRRFSYPQICVAGTNAYSWLPTPLPGLDQTGFLASFAAPSAVARNAFSPLLAGFRVDPQDTVVAGDGQHFRRRVNLED